MHILGIFFYNYDFKKCEIKYLIQRNKRGDDDKRTLNEMFKFLFTIILFANLKIWYNYVHWLEKKSYKRNIEATLPLLTN